ncbi:hypothetical protein DFR70_12720 [Nocardia tenerifensis]|uniref:Uncharacterized protein n=1 Tax=Nocardia tenerifensis TaxID=228006 RepID=A0A318KAH4_9NOCA|nr:hypothetical protein [Nocardia tenerifensis]PXX53409.1 hypothetical protein DFR70_12720 [Nocardia tenerifensis]
MITLPRLADTRLGPASVESRVALEATTIAGELAQPVDWLHVAFAATTATAWDETAAALLGAIDVPPESLRAELVTASPQLLPVDPELRMAWLSIRFGYTSRITADYLWAAYFADHRVARVLTDHGFDPLSGECLVAAEAALPGAASTCAVTEALPPHTGSPASADTKQAQCIYWRLCSALDWRGRPRTPCWPICGSRSNRCANSSTR